MQLANFSNDSVSNALDVIKELICENGFRDYLKKQTKICLGHVDNGVNVCQITVVLLNDDVMSFLTIRKSDSPFIGWKITPETNRLFDAHKQNFFSNNENNLYVLKYRTVKKVVKDFYEWLAEPAS